MRALGRTCRCVVGRPVGSRLCVLRRGQQAGVGTGGQGRGAGAGGGARGAARWEGPVRGRGQASTPETVPRGWHFTPCALGSRRSLGGLPCGQPQGGALGQGPAVRGAEGPRCCTRTPKAPARDPLSCRGLDAGGVRVVRPGSRQEGRRPRARGPVQTRRPATPVLVIRGSRVLPKSPQTLNQQTQPSGQNTRTYTSHRNRRLKS